MASGQLAALTTLIEAADAVAGDPTEENVARLLAARPEPVDLDRLGALQEPEPVTIGPGLYYTGQAVGEIGTMLYRVAFKALDFEAFGMLRRALRGYFRKVAPG
jgi:hypothetical protein